MPNLICDMRARGNSDAERLKRETERILYDCRREIRQLNLTESVARRNIREFLENLSQFQDLNTNEAAPARDRMRRSKEDH